MTLDEKPLFGAPPAFPWETLTASLTSAFQLKSLKFTPGIWEWRPQDQLFTGLGDTHKIFTLNFSPLVGKLWWVMSDADYHRMLTQMVSIEGLEATDPEISEALTTFFTIQLLEVFGKCGFDKQLSLQILSQSSPPDSPCLAIDVETSINDVSFPSRLLLSPEFRQNWKQRYMQDQKKMLLESPLADSLEVIVHLEAGRLNIGIGEWNQLQQGDFVVLESCSLDPLEDKGRVMLVINGTPYFRGKLKQGNLKILEYPLYYEVPSMNAPNDEKNEEEDFDVDFDDIENEADKKAPPAKAEEKKPAAPAAAPAKKEEEDFDFDIEEEEEKPIEDVDEFASEEKKPEGAAAATPTAKVEKAPEAPKKPTPLEDVPLCVVLEVGRFQMSVKKLLELQPGNMLELDIHPEAGVDMVVNGKRVARGELIKIGDAIGVKIAERY